MALRNKKPKDENENNVDTSSLGSAKETQPRDDTSNDSNAAPPPRRKPKKKDDKGPKQPSVCRFCEEVFVTPQALGGHMNRHREARAKEEFQKAETLIHTKGQTFTLGYPGGGAGPSYYHYQPEGGYVNHYQGGGTPRANAAPMMGSMGGGLPRQVYRIPNQHPFVGAQQMNPNYGSNQQQTTQAIFPSQPQHGGPYVNYNQYDRNAPRPPQISTGVPQTSYTPPANSGQYQGQPGTGSLRDARPHAMSHGGSSSTGVARVQSNTSFTGHNLSQAAGGATSSPTVVDNLATLGSNSANAGVRPSTANQAVAAQFVDQRGNVGIQGASSAGYSTKLRPLNPSHFNNNIQASSELGRGTPQVPNAGTSGHGSIQVQSDEYAAVGMLNEYLNTPGVGLWNFKDEQDGDEYGNGGPDMY